VDHPRSSEIPFPVTGSVPIYREEEQQPQPKPRPRAWWVLMVGAGSALTAMSFPGQTAGLSVFTDPLLLDLALDRTAISVSYLIATLVGALAMPFLGRIMDRVGTKRVIVVTGFLLVFVLVGASFMTEIMGLTASYVGLRMTGQGALVLAATTLIARSVTHRPGLALGIVGAVGSMGISLAPLGVERLIAWTDIASAWRIEAIMVALIVIPIAVALPKDVPITHTPTGTIITKAPEPGYTLGEALRSGMFWVITSAMIVSGMLGTGLAFHLISILGAQGLTPTEAAANFIPQTVAAVLTTLVFGAVVDRTDPRWGVVVSMLTLSAALIFVPFVEPGLFGLYFGLLVGGSMGALRGVDSAALVRFYGRAHIGSIRGTAASLQLASTALGPLYFAVGLQLSGSYVGPSMLAALIPATVALVALFVKPPVTLE
jgi:MFS family permease